MHCEEINNHIANKISDIEFEKHLLSCTYCREMNTRIDSAMSILELKSAVPENLVASVLSKKNHVQSIKKDPIAILQIASVIAAAVLLGIFLGKNSDTDFIRGKESKKLQHLIEYREIHHFNINQELF
jgi:hypothetical protein